MPLRTKILAATAALVAFASAATADGLTFKLEGGRGIIDFADTGIFMLEKGTPPSDTEFGDWVAGMHRGPQSAFYRSELDWDMALANGKTLRFGLIGLGLDGSHSEETPVYSWLETAIKYEKDGIHSVTHTALRFCPVVDGQVEACGTFIGGLDRSYREIMPQVLLGSQSDGNRITWIGLRGFVGELDEMTVGRVETESNTPADMITELSAKAKGLLLAFQRESKLPSGATLTLGLGLGGYHMSTASNAYNEGEKNPNATRHYSFNGARAQASIGMEYPLTKALSLGGTIRADYWSAQPRVELDVAAPECQDGRTVCHGTAPSPKGLSGVTDPLMSLSVGISLTLRM